MLFSVVFGDRGVVLVDAGRGEDGTGGGVGRGVGIDEDVDDSEAANACCMKGC